MVTPHANSKPDFWIFNQLAKRFPNGQRIHFPETVAEAFEEMKQLSKGEGRTLDISGMDHDKIEQAKGIQWPFREGQEGLKGDMRLYTDVVFQSAHGRENLIPLPFIDNYARSC